jgi:hypothetical protein
MASILVLAIIGGFFVHSLFLSGAYQSLRGCIASAYGIGVSALFYSERFRGLSSIFTGGGDTGGGAGETLVTRGRKI